MIKEAIGKLVAKENLTEDEVREAMTEVVTRKASSAQIASFLTALRMKGETIEEITAAANVIRERSLRLPLGEEAICLDREEITLERETIMRTAKADSGETTIFNISTATAFVVAGGGVKVTKYVRRPEPPLCGCANVIEALGIDLDLTPSQIERCFETLGICFFHDGLVHKGMDHLLVLRKRIGIRTLFNLLDPLVNPGGATLQILGVYDPHLTETMARVLLRLGIRRGLVVYGRDTLDEISLTGETRVTELNDKGIHTSTIRPEDFGLQRRSIEEIKGGTQEENARIILRVLKGEKGGARDIVLLNAAAAFYLAGRARDLREGIEMAGRSIDSGEALRTLERLIQFTHEEDRFVRREWTAGEGGSPLFD
ncbi:MAG: anthranilate phosphoribosyltransferase [Desulfobacterota bacterium]|nr:anthranilate phosphoribosyltransferase [Thermodesulfobacteriota bacterium]